MRAGLTSAQSLAAAEAAIAHAGVISTDVFDTLLLRTLRSERARILAAERRFALQLAEAGFAVSADTLFEARLRVQQLAFRALDVGGRGEARLRDIVARQLHVLGLPQSFVEARLDIELAVERDSLIANRALADLLRARKRNGARVVAVSDTTLTAAHVQALLDYFHGPGLVDHVYSSADLAATKRRGDLFTLVAKAEAVAPSALVHLGDDAWADVRMPKSLGADAVHLPRPRVLQHLRAARGAATEAGRRVRAAAHASLPSRAREPEALASEVLGPLLTQFCQRIWLYTSQAEQTHSTVLLFCARGGIGIREAFERALPKLDLPLRSRRENLLVSRLIAVRSALLARSPMALEELGREFEGESFASVAEALGGRAYELPAPWHERFVASELWALLQGASGAEVLADIRQQAALFERHLRALAQPAERLILCDTGLYGSTQRLLQQGFPELHFESIQFARSNYKRFAEEHFPRVTGLMVQENFYNPLVATSCVLRYWHLIESFFEPKLASVRVFHALPDGGVSANCGAVDHERLDRNVHGPLLTAALRYIDGLSPTAGAQVFEAAERAAAQLRRAITRPSQLELNALSVGTRSKDFGRETTMEVMSPEPASHFMDRLRSIRSQHWREGAITRDFPMLKHALLPALSSAYVLRRFVGRG